MAGISATQRQVLVKLSSKLAEVPLQRIAIIKPSALGDIVHALPVLTAIRQKFRSAHIAWVVNSAYSSLLKGHPDLDEVIPLDRGSMKKGLRKGSLSFLHFLKQLRKKEFDCVIDLQGLLRSGMMCLATGAKYKLGLNSAREGARWFYNALLPDQARVMHAIDRYWLAVEALGIKQNYKHFRFPDVGPERLKWATTLTNHPRPWVAMNLGTRWETKRWPVASFAELGKRVSQKYGGTMILVGGPDEEPLAQEYQTLQTEGVVTLVRQTNLRELLAVLQLSDLMLSNDSGPLHMAVAVGKPVLAPYLCTTPVATGPYQQEKHALLTQVPCAASYLKKCSHLSCRKELQPNRFLPLLDSLLSCPKTFL